MIFFPLLILVCLLVFMITLNLFLAIFTFVFFLQIRKMIKKRTREER